jgi:hypothetical protein
MIDNMVYSRASLYPRDYNIFCVGFLGYWNWLKTEDDEIFSIKSYAMYNYNFFSYTTSAMTKYHTCEDLIEMCKNQYGEWYVYVQASYSYIPFFPMFSIYEGVIDENDELCPYYRLQENGSGDSSFL